MHLGTNTCVAFKVQIDHQTGPNLIWSSHCAKDIWKTGFFPPGPKTHRFWGCIYIPTPIRMYSNGPCWACWDNLTWRMMSRIQKIMCIMINVTDSLPKLLGRWPASDFPCTISSTQNHAVQLSFSIADASAASRQIIRISMAPRWRYLEPPRQCRNRWRNCWFSLPGIP